MINRHEQIMFYFCVLFRCNQESPIVPYCAHWLGRISCFWIPTVRLEKKTNNITRKVTEWAVPELYRAIKHNTSSGIILWPLFYLKSREIICWIKSTSNILPCPLSHSQLRIDNAAVFPLFIYQINFTIPVPLGNRPTYGRRGDMKHNYDVWYLKSKVSILYQLVCVNL